MAIFASYSYPHLLPIAVLFLIITAGSPVHGIETLNQTCPSPTPRYVLPIYPTDINLLQFPQNIEHLEADFFLFGALGRGLDDVAPELTLGGPPPIGAQKANLDAQVQRIIREFAFEEVGHLRVLKSTFGGIPRPLMDLSAGNFGRVINSAFERPLDPPFDPYRDSLSFMMASYIIPYVGLTGYVGANPQTLGHVSKGVLAGLLGVEAGQDAIIRTYLFVRAYQIVTPYNFTVAEFANKISILRNTLGMCGVKDEGVIVPPELGAEGQSATNVLSANLDSISYARTPAEILRILYLTGDEHTAGGFYPEGANGKVATSFLDRPIN